MKSIPTIDAHHHIWRLNDLPWLSGPEVPRIFGPYQPICSDYSIYEYRTDIVDCDIVKSIYIQTQLARVKRARNRFDSTRCRSRCAKGQAQTAEWSFTIPVLI